MKLTKRLLTAGMALGLALGLNVPAFAEVPQTTGTITVTNATIGATYAGYKLFDVTYSGSNVAYSITSNSKFYTAVAGEDDPFALEATSTEGVYTVSLEENKSEDDVATWISNLVKNTTFTADLASTEAEDETVSWENVPYGYYFVTSSLGTVVTVDQNTPNVEIIDKNQKPGSDFTKTVAATDEVMQIGVPFTFTMTFTATNYDGETPIEEYTISDTFPEGMDLVPTAEDAAGNVTITIDDGSEETTTLYKNVEVNGDRTFQFDIDWSTSTSTGHTFTYNSPATVTVTYQAVLNEDAVIEGDGETNAATLTWTGNPTTSKKEDSATVYTYALAIKKVNKNADGLEGATFTLKDSEGNVVNVSEVGAGSGVYVVDPDGNATITSPTSGLIIIKGVDGVNPSAEGDTEDDVTYTLTETKAPDGYNLLKDPVTVHPVATGKEETDTTIYLDEDGNVVKQEENPTTTVEFVSDIPATAVAVLNKAGTTLPSTGGMGTTILYIVGIVLVLGAGITLVVRRRMNQDR